MSKRRFLLLRIVCLSLCLLLASCGPAVTSNTLLAPTLETLTEKSSDTEVVNSSMTSETSSTSVAETSLVTAATSTATTITTTATASFENPSTSRAGQTSSTTTSAMNPARSSSSRQLDTLHQVSVVLPDGWTELLDESDFMYMTNQNVVVLSRYPFAAKNGDAYFYVYALDKTPTWENYMMMAESFESAVDEQGFDAAWEAYIDIGYSEDVLMHFLQATSGMGVDVGERTFLIEEETLRSDLLAYALVDAAYSLQFFGDTEIEGRKVPVARFNCSNIDGQHILQKQTFYLLDDQMYLLVVKAPEPLFYLLSEEIDELWTSMEFSENELSP